ncbi:hypothetical protein QRO08_15955 [Paracidovorax citrulli]|uniref:Uncharacterized protein n=1 Tax=Paracidovorax citrulli TaxID=80869 RepID=A0ABY9AK60_PARCI|nr:hypothetical protein [Paracidovorax citrulli]MVT28531.1 hypothetical protein [Paracidovorax citrulli]PVY66544.1 hypothetical protein C8E08_3953 [Paracidovorax citrulli]REG69287.1 hypothetical protein C8E07_2434 [Paracidovorax citrulli]RLJ93842.1 hypothetical protein C8E06_2434 [Paracidovorax citrulli]WIY32359.1 hypothetical protein QRO09_11830 [Paracidovorax citrulli]
MTATLTKPLTFALAGRLVTSSKEATAILIDAIRTRKTWLEPQARSVRAKLRAAGQ